jgi:hypothetical protein
MKRKSTKRIEVDTLRPEYNRTDLGKGVRGKHYAEFQKGTNLISLHADLAKSFPTSESVNEALRTLLKVAADTQRLTKPVSRATRKKLAA